MYGFKELLEAKATKAGFIFCTLVVVASCIILFTALGQGREINIGPVTFGKIVATKKEMTAEDELIQEVKSTRLYFEKQRDILQNELIQSRKDKVHGPQGFSEQVELSVNITNYKNEIEKIETEYFEKLSKFIEQLKRMSSPQ
ncbi:hypothetical protein SAMN02745704_01094 [Paucidesulfovibrio gracilis DSM 16080]|uniref:Uncharacterized protein n=1 Tax=Paucidesulfovibrio gracilis DSM 16080 TaxID=1121449 RepID=A0A1T4WLB8_9BACT|nr:hypothetical protein [Paucidesulfovibrio gracilis]SKA78146.1 hypothetical protein SAMN02745704_01094 [Paucidesulfovibrio gracilis DSM 16080]